MKRRKSKRRPPGYTPSLPGCGHELIPPVSVKGEAPPATCFSGSFLSGFSCASGDPKARAEGCAAIERRREEAEEALDDARFRGWALARHGEDYDRYEARKEFDEWCGARDGNDPRYEDGQ